MRKNAKRGMASVAVGKELRYREEKKSRPQDDDEPQPKRSTGSWSAGDRKKAPPLRIDTGLADMILAAAPSRDALVERVFTTAAVAFGSRNGMFSAEIAATYGDALDAFESIRRAEDLGYLHEALMTRKERSGRCAFYTPTHLADAVVQKTLEPLLRTLGKQRTAAQILSLMICDAAVGGGVFPICLLRRLASEVRRAWRRHGEEDLGEQAAKRLVAQHCLYGVDKNATAVRLTRLVIWLEVGDASLTPEELSPSIKCGDALVGFDLRQIEAFHWDRQPHEEAMWAELNPKLASAIQRASAGDNPIEELSALACICKKHKSQGFGTDPGFWHLVVEMVMEREATLRRCRSAGKAECLSGSSHSKHHESSQQP